MEIFDKYLLTYNSIHEFPRILILKYEGHLESS